MIGKDPVQEAMIVPIPEAINAVFEHASEFVWGVSNSCVKIQWKRILRFTLRRNIYQTGISSFNKERPKTTLDISSTAAR